MFKTYYINNFSWSMLNPLRAKYCVKCWQLFSSAEDIDNWFIQELSFFTAGAGVGNKLLPSSDEDNYSTDEVP